MILFYSVENPPQGLQADEDYQRVDERLHSGVSLRFLPHRNTALPLVSCT